MNVIEALYKEIDNIKKDYASGSTEIATKALDIVTAAIDLELHGNDYFPQSIASMLQKAKPTMTAVEVICNYAVDDYKKVFVKGKKYFCVEVRNKMQRAGEKTIINAYNKLFTANNKTTFNISTCTYSSNIIKLLRLADKNKIEINLFAVQSVWNNFDYSEQLVDSLSDTNINSSIISYKEFKQLQPNIDFCLIGADGYDKTHNVVNGVPTKLLAETAYPDNKLYVVAESFKMVENLRTGDGFELIPARFVSEILTDDEVWHNEYKKQFVD